MNGSNYYLASALVSLVQCDEPDECRADATQNEQHLQLQDQFMHQLFHRLLQKWHQLSLRPRGTGTKAASAQPAILLLPTEH